jgi:hypothetical protein
MFSKHNRAQPHRENAVLDAHSEHLTIMLFRVASLDILAMDSLGQHILLISISAITFRGICESQCVHQQPHTPDELKEEISSLVIRINADSLRRVADNFQHQLQLVLEHAGSETEHDFY